MAFYHLTFKVRSRTGSPISGLRHAAYLTRQTQGKDRHHQVPWGEEWRRYTVRDGYTKRQDLVYAEHGNLPTWAEENGLRFWASADRYERQNGRIYRELEVALPRELPREQWVQVARDFTQTMLKDRHPYTLAVHAPISKQDGREQPHFHLQYSTRTHDGIERSEAQYWKRADRVHPERGGAYKEPAWDKRSTLYAVRETWARVANEALERAGRDERIDHRSYRERVREIDRERLFEEITREQRDELARYRAQQARDTRRVREPRRQKRGVALLEPDAWHTTRDERGVPVPRQTPARGLHPRKQRLFRVDLEEREEREERGMG